MNDFAFVLVVCGGFLALLSVLVALSLIARVNRALQQLSEWVWR